MCQRKSRKFLLQTRKNKSFFFSQKISKHYEVLFLTINHHDNNMYVYIFLYNVEKTLAESCVFIVNKQLKTSHFMKTKQQSQATYIFGD